MVSALNSARDVIKKDALISGISNALINGAIGWFMFRGKDTLPLTVDTISAHEKTVFSTGVMTAFILSVILGAIAFSSFGKKARSLHLASPELLDRPFFFFGLRTILFYSLFVFGTAALAALFVQKFAGTILVTPLVGAIVLGAIAGVAAWFINAAVMKAMLRPE
ncbi:MAG: permease [Leptolyngbyaceae cyanobacterium SM2_5_2]|nr:permease [Leptolyngbyaceae cyanobacterium SM2_5_2]